MVTKTIVEEKRTTIMAMMTMDGINKTKRFQKGV